LGGKSADSKHRRGNPSREKQIRDDLLDISCSARQLDSDVAVALARLDELESLFGPSAGGRSGAAGYVANGDRPAREADALPVAAAVNGGRTGTASAAPCAATGVDEAADALEPRRAPRPRRHVPALRPGPLRQWTGSGYDDAIQSLTVCIALEPANPRVLRARGLAFLNEQSTVPRCGR